MFQSQEDVPGFPETITNDSCHCSHVHPSSTHTILLSRPSRPCCVARPHKSRPRHLGHTGHSKSLCLRFAPLFPLYYSLLSLPLRLEKRRSFLPRSRLLHDLL